MVSVEQWAEIRRLYFAKRLSIKEIVRCIGHGRNTIRRALRSDEVPRYRRPPRPSKLDPFREETGCWARTRACPASGCRAARGATVALPQLCQCHPRSLSKNAFVVLTANSADPRCPET